MVNTSSPNGLNGGTPGHVNYAVAKSGIATMTITLARELAPYGVRCNAIAPVAFTRMTASLRGSGVFVDDNREVVRPRQCGGRRRLAGVPPTVSISGHVFGVHGRHVDVWESWRTVANVESSQRTWTIDRLADVQRHLFAGSDPGVPPLESNR